MTQKGNIVELEAEAPPAPMRKARRPDGNVPLNITSLMDAISILLCYLLVSISVDPWAIRQDQYLSLAMTSAETEPRDSLAIVVNRKEILVDGAHALPIDCMTSAARGAHQCRTDEDFGHEDNVYAIDKSYKEDGSDESFKVAALLTVLQEKLASAREMHQARGIEGEFRAIATIICDKNIPYRIVAEVVNTMGQAGIENIRFAIVRGDRWTP